MHGDLVGSTSCRLLSQSAIILFVESGISQGRVWKGRDSKHPWCQSPGPPQTVLVAEAQGQSRSEWQLVTGETALSSTVCLLMFAEMHMPCAFTYSGPCVCTC